MKQLTLRQLNRIEEKPFFSVKDPISALTHFIGFLSSIALTPLILSVASFHNQNNLTMFSLSVYMLSMILLYGASTSYHSFVLPEKSTVILKKIDHMSIFILIAGSYTPICLSVLHNHTGSIMFFIVWLVAILGIIMKALWINCPKYVSSIVYISMGWIAIFSIKSIYLSLPLTGFIFLVTGGVFYTIGGVLYAFKISFNKDWGNHEIFHLFVLAGSLFHFLLMLLYVA